LDQCSWITHQFREVLVFGQRVSTGSQHFWDEIDTISIVSKNYLSGRLNLLVGVLYC
jgi:hypothetical protein